MAQCHFGPDGAQRLADLAKLGDGGFLLGRGGAWFGTLGALRGSGRRGGLGERGRGGLRRRGSRGAGGRLGRGLGGSGCGRGAGGRFLLRWRDRQRGQARGRHCRGGGRCGGGSSAGRIGRTACTSGDGGGNPHRQSRRQQRQQSRFGRSGFAQLGGSFGAIGAVGGQRGARRRESQRRDRLLNRLRHVRQGRDSRRQIAAALRQACAGGHPRGGQRGCRRGGQCLVTRFRLFRQRAKRAHHRHQIKRRCRWRPAFDTRSGQGLRTAGQHRIEHSCEIERRTTPALPRHSARAARKRLRQRSSRQRGSGQFGQERDHRGLLGEVG